MIRPKRLDLPKKTSLFGVVEISINKAFRDEADIKSGIKRGHKATLFVPLLRKIDKAKQIGFLQ